MATTAKFGIQSTADVGPIKTLQAELAKIPEMLKAWNAAMSAFSPVVESVVSKATKVFQEGEQKVTAAKQESSDRIKALFNAMAVNGEMAREREVKSEQAADAKIGAIKQTAAQKEEALRAKAEQKATEQQAKANARAEQQSAKEQAHILAREQKEQTAAQKEEAIRAKAEQKATEAQAKTDARAQSAAQKEEAIRAKAEQKAAEANAKREAREKQAADRSAQQAEKAAQKKAQAEEREAAKSSKQIVTDKRTANQLLAEQEQHLAEITAKYSKDKHGHLSKDLRELQAENERTANAIRSTNNKEIQAELKERQAEVAQEIKLMKQVAAEKKAEESKGGHKEGGVEHGLKEGLGFGIAVEGLHMLKEAAEETIASERQLQAGTGLVGKSLEEAGKKAEEIGDKFAISGEKSKETMGRVAGLTHLQGEDLDKLTEATLAYERTTGLSADKLVKSEKGRQKILADAALNIAKAEAAAQTPAANMERIQHKLTETIGMVAMTVLDALGPALKAVTPILSSLGELITSVVKPAMEALNPIMKLIAEQFTKLAPVIVSLVKDALSILTPIISNIGDVLGALIPPIIEVVSVIAQSLQPVFKALTPIIMQIAGIIKEVLVKNIGFWVSILQDVVVPLIRDLVAPILLSLMPIIKLIADITQATLVPAMTGLSSIMKWLMDNVVQPLIKWLSGGLVGAIQSVVGVVTEAIQAVSKITNALGSLLGMGDDAKEATKKSGEEVAKQDEENNQVLKQQKITQMEQEKSDKKKHLLELLKLGKISAAQEQELREEAQQNGDDSLLSKLDAFDKKKEAQAAKAGKNAAKSAAERAKIKADAELDELKDSIIEKNETEKKARVDELTGEVAHAAAILAIYKEGTKQYAKAHAALTVANKNLTLAQHADALEDQKNLTAQTLSELELRGIKENLSEYEVAQKRFGIEQQALKEEIALRASFGEDVSKLQAQFDANEFKHAAEEKKNAISAEKELLQVRRDADKRKLEDMKSRHFAESVIAKMETDITLDEEEKRHQDEMEKLKGNDAAIIVEQEKHTGMMTYITQQGATKQKQILLSQAQYLGGPIAAGVTAGFKLMMKGADAWTSKMAQSNNILESIFGNILSSFLQMMEGMIEKIIAVEAVLLVANLIPGFGAFMDSIAAVGSLIPGHAAGTDSSPGGLHWVGEKGPELMNLPSGSQIIPNHHLPNLGQPPVDLSPLLGSLNAIHVGVQQSNRIFAARPAPVLSVNDNFRETFNKSVNAEGRRSV